MNFRGFGTAIVLKCDEEIMWDLLWIVLCAVGFLAYTVLRARERFVIRVGNPFKDQELLSFDRYGKGTRLIGFYPDTCPGHKPELSDGLCYRPCAPGYRGVLSVCWAETTNIGPGVFAKLKSCENSGYKRADGWQDMGLFCYKQIKCDTGSGWDVVKFWDWKCSGGSTAFKEAECPPGGREIQEFKKVAEMATRSTQGTQQSNLKQKLNTTPNPNLYSDAVGGMCYKPCPKDRPNHASAAPYLCFRDSAGRGFSYDRGVGEIPPLFILGEG